MSPTNQQPLTSDEYQIVASGGDVALSPTPAQPVTCLKAIERLHENERLRSNLTDNEAHGLLTIAEHLVIWLGAPIPNQSVNWLDSETYAAVERFVAEINGIRGRQK